jgi:hypothetical protein
MISRILFTAFLVLCALVIYALLVMAGRTDDDAEQWGEIRGQDKNRPDQ